MKTGERHATRRVVKIPRGKKAASAAALSKSYFTDLFLADPMQQVVLIRKGIPAKALVKTSKAMQLSSEHLYKVLRFPASTVKRKLERNEMLTPEQSERILGLQRMIGQVQTIVAESGDADKAFNAAEWVANWLEEPIPALGNQKPGEFMDTVAGQEMISNLLARMQSGAYA